MSGRAPVSPVIVWFRRDLRLADNPALLAAVQRSQPVVPLFVWSPEEEAPWAPGAASRWWLHGSLEALRGALRAGGSELILRRGPAEEALLALVEETGATAVVWNRLYEPALIVRDRALKPNLRERGIEVHSFRGNLLFEPWTIQNASGAPFKVFTAFSNACRKASAPAAPLPSPQSIPAPERWPRSLDIGELELEPHIDWAAGLRETWQPGESGAARALEDFSGTALEQYAAERDRPDHLGTSRLSPHLHFGEISPQQIWHALPMTHDAAGSYRRQLLWREFAHHLLFHFPHAAEQPMRPEFARFPWRMNEAHLRAWTRGLTGYPLVDAGMRELWHTGWMHNRVRMAAASFLVKHLLIPWQEGAAWFWDTLVDADLANNTLGWQWVAGCGADAAPYFRVFNPELQAKKFDPDGAYVRRWIPEIGTPAYPEPIVNHEQARRRTLAAFEEMRQQNRG